MSCENCDARIRFQSDIVELKTNYGWLREAVEAIQESTKKIAQCSEQMVKLEAESIETREALRRAFKSIEREESARAKADEALASEIRVGCTEISVRLSKIEEDMPSLRLTKTIVFGVIGMAMANIGGIIWVIAHIDKLVN